MTFFCARTVVQKAIVGKATSGGEQDFSWGSPGRVFRSSWSQRSW